MPLFSEPLIRYGTELLTTARFWEDHCVDRACGGYFHFLDRDGSAFDTAKFMWMEWRIVYMFATLATSEYARPGWLEIARHGYDFLIRHGKDEHGNCYFALNRQGVPMIAPCNIYSDCFAAMGCAAMFKATGDSDCRREAEAAMQHYVARIGNPKGRWEKSLAGNPKRLSHGHYMILANLGYVLNECLGTDRYDRDIASAADKVLGTFWNPERRVLFENVNPDGSFDLDSCDGRHVNPGHALESMWFIMQHAEQARRPDTIDRACEITKAMLEFGWDRQHGGILYFMDALGKPHLALEADMKLWWVHNEAILAVLFAYRLTGEQCWLEWFRLLDDWTWRHFPDPQFGEWFGYLNRAGEPTHLLKGGKWKTFFHVPRFLLTGIRQMKMMAETRT